MAFAERENTTNVDLSTMSEFQTHWDFEENPTNDKEDPVVVTLDDAKITAPEKKIFSIFEKKKNLPNAKNLPNETINLTNEPKSQTNEPTTPSTAKTTVVPLVQSSAKKTPKVTNISSHACSIWKETHF